MTKSLSWLCAALVALTLSVLTPAVRDGGGRAVRGPDLDR